MCNGARYENVRTMHGSFLERQKTKLRASERSGVHCGTQQSEISARNTGRRYVDRSQRDTRASDSESPLTQAIRAVIICDSFDVLSRAGGSKKRWQDSNDFLLSDLTVHYAGAAKFILDFQAKKAPMKGLFRFTSRSVLVSPEATTRIGIVCAIAITVYPYRNQAKRIFPE